MLILYLLYCISHFVIAFFKVYSSQHHCLSHSATGQQACLDRVACVCVCGLHLPALNAPVLSIGGGVTAEKAVPSHDDALLTSFKRRLRTFCAHFQLHLIV